MELVVAEVVLDKEGLESCLFDSFVRACVSVSVSVGRIRGEGGWRYKMENRYQAKCSWGVELINF